jgi:acylphosphatase
MNQETILVIVKGNVQGVFYRQSTREKASELGITGKVTNMEDCSVQVIATGSPEKLQKLTDWCRVGPPKARVSDIEIKKLELQLFDRFAITR